jgi:hypothetical protein
VVAQLLEQLITYFKPDGSNPDSAGTSGQCYTILLAVIYTNIGMTSFKISRRQAEKVL